MAFFQCDDNERKRLLTAKCRVIYQPKGPALEYAPLALNLGVGCSHRCRYCYGPKAAQVEPEIFRSGMRVRDRILERLEKDVALLRGDNREILLSFLADPYCPEEPEVGLTRRAIKILVANDLRFTVLTKGGMRAARDFDLLAGYEKSRFGTTLVFTSQADASHWEPNSASIADRIEAIKTAHDKGIKTWISLEPVIDPRQALELVKALNPVVDHWKIGKLNYNKGVSGKVDWYLFKMEITSMLDCIGADYYLKKSLRDLGE